MTQTTINLFMVAEKHLFMHRKTSYNTINNNNCKQFNLVFKIDRLQSNL